MNYDELFLHWSFFGGTCLCIEYFFWTSRPVLVTLPSMGSRDKSTPPNSMDSKQVIQSSITARPSAGGESLGTAELEVKR